MFWKRFWTALAQFFARKAGMVVTYHWRTFDVARRFQQNINHAMPLHVVYEVNTRGAPLSASDQHRIVKACYGGIRIPNGADYGAIRKDLDYKGQAVITIRSPKFAPPAIELDNDMIAYLRDTHG